MKYLEKVTKYLLQFAYIYCFILAMICGWNRDFSQATFFLVLSMVDYALLIKIID